MVFFFNFECFGAVSVECGSGFSIRMVFLQLHSCFFNEDAVWRGRRVSERGILACGLINLVVVVRI